MVGNHGGMGKVPSSVRTKARESFYRLIPRFADIAAGKKVKQTVAAVTPDGQVVTAEADAIPKLADQVRAFDALGKYGLSGNITPDDVRARLMAQYEIISGMLEPEQAQALIARLSAEVWK